LDWVRIFRQLYGLDWIHELMDWIGLGQQKWTHVQLWLCLRRTQVRGA